MGLDRTMHDLFDARPGPRWWVRSAIAHPTETRSKRMLQPGVGHTEELRREKLISIFSFDHGES